MSFQIVLRLPGDAETVGLVRSLVTAALDRVGVQPACIDDIRLALSEACNNVIEHAATSDAYEVRVEVDDVQCLISVIDGGHGFDADSLAREMPDPSSIGGRGISIMAAVSDGMDLSSQPETGTIVRLVKALSFAPDGPFADFLRRS